MDSILQILRETEWTYGEHDPMALQILEDRIASAARKRQLITYSELVQDVKFALPNLERPRVIDTSEWHDLDRAIVGSFLGYISMRSYDRAKFFASALVVNKKDGTPGEGFNSLLRDVGLIPNTKSPKALELWAKHVARAHTWFAEH